MEYKNQSAIKLFATFLVAFLLAFMLLGTLSPTSNTSALDCNSGTVPSSSSDPSDASSTPGAPSASNICGTDTADVHVSVEGSWAISVSSSGTLSLDLTPTSTGTFSMVTDNLNIYTNIPTGYQLYLNSTTGSTDIYSNNILDDNGNLSANLPAGTNTNHFTATTGTKDAPVALSSNTWGYSLDNSPTTFSKVPLTSEDPDSNIYSNPNKTPSSGDNIPVTYGFKADTSLTPGTYSTSVTYTAIADAPTYAITSVSPNELKLDDQTDKTITIMTSTPTSELAFGEVSAKIGTVDLTDCTEITNNGFRGVTCVYSSNLNYGTYNVELTSSWHNATYVLANGLKIGDNRTMSDITYMQEMNSDICTNSTTDTAYTLKDSRDQKSYRIRKHKDNNCWMNQNLALDGNRTLTPADSNVTENRKLPANISNGTSSDTYGAIYSGGANSYTSSCYYPNCVVSTEKYGNLYNFSSATAVSLSTLPDSPTYYESVCPSGSGGETWRLPDNGDRNTNKSYGKLMYSYGLSDTSVNSPSAVKTVQVAPLSFPLSGYYFGTSVQSTYRYFGTYWSRSKTVGKDAVYILRFYATSTGDFNPQAEYWQSTMLSIRCVFGE